MNKKDILDKIKSLEGLDNTEKAYLVNLVNTTKKYGLVWEDKPEDVEEELRTKLPVLKELKERAIINDTETEKHPNHILIEGDNLHALTALTFSHEGLIDVIYIDPPYNTGGKDFRYNDTFVDKEDSFRHSKWLSFMNKRLQIAKKLLNKNGIIFISIDDNENAQLKLICDDVFGEDNFVGNVIRPTGTTTGQDTGGLGKSFDYLLSYSITKNFQIKGIELTEDDLKRYNLKDKVGNFSILQLRRTGGEDRREDRPTMYFPINAPDGTEVYPKGPTGYESRWRVGKNKVENMIKEDKLYFKKSGKEWRVYYKYYAENKTKRPSNIWNDLDGNKKAQIEMKDVFDKKVFETPKPMSLINRILKLTTESNKEMIILDFFAGSGTTLHTTMALNAEDGGNRNCIMVTNNENNICEEVTYERNKRVIQGYTNNKGDKVTGLTNNNLRYYKCNFVDRKPSLSNKKQLTLLATELLCIKENCYKEVTSSLLKAKWHKLFTNGQNNFVYVIYDDFYIEDAIEALNTFIDSHSEDITIKVYVFSNGQYAYAEEFEAIAANITLAALPDAIYKAYQNVLPKEEKEEIPTLEDDINLETAN